MFGPWTNYPTLSGDCCGAARDLAGPAVAAALRELVPALEPMGTAFAVVADERAAIADALLSWTSRSLGGGAAARLVVTTGGTGLGPRDVTPEATRPLLEREAPGLVHAMLAFGLSRTPLAALSRYCAGTRGRTLIVNMPGSPKAVRECVEALRAVLPHALGLVGGE